MAWFYRLEVLPQAFLQGATGWLPITSDELFIES